MLRTWKLGNLTGSQLGWSRDGRFAKQTFRNPPNLGHPRSTLVSPKPVWQFHRAFPETETFVLTPMLTSKMLDLMLDSARPLFPAAAPIFHWGL